MKKYVKFNTFFFLLSFLLILVGCRKEPKYIDTYVICKEGKYGLIDSLGNEIVKPRFLYVEPITKDGVALAIIDTIYTTTKDSTILGLMSIPVLNIKYGYITCEDKFIFPKPSYAKIKIENVLDSINAYSDFCQVFPFYGGLAAIQDTISSKYGFISLSGDTIISPQYKSVKKFKQGRAAVQLDYTRGNRNSGKWGLIDPKGNKVCDFIFSKLNTPVNDRAIAIINMVDKQEACKIEGELAKDKKGNVYVDKSKGYTIEESDTPVFFSKIFLVDGNGKVINENLDITYQYSNFTKDGIAVASPNGMGQFLGRGYGFINKDGDFIKPLNVNEITEEKAKKIVESKYFLNEFLPPDIEFTDVSRFTDGYAAVNLGRAWVFVDKELILRGNEENPIYENALPFSYGLAGVKLDGKFGYINTDFNITIPCKYDSCAIAGKNLCRVYGGKRIKHGYSIISYINRNNEVVWQSVDYNDSFFEKQSKIDNQGGWEEIEYQYIGKNYTPIWIIICIIILLSIIIVFAKSHHKRKTHNIISEEVSNDKEYISENISTDEIVKNNSQLLPLEDSKKYEIILTKEDVNISDNISGDISEGTSEDVPKRTIQDRLNDILK